MRPVVRGAGPAAPRSRGGLHRRPTDVGDAGRAGLLGARRRTSSTPGALPARRGRLAGSPRGRVLSKLGPELLSSKERHVGHGAAPTTGPVTPRQRRRRRRRRRRGHVDRAAQPTICLGGRTSRCHPPSAVGCRSELDWAAGGEQRYPAIRPARLPRGYRGRLPPHRDVRRRPSRATASALPRPRRARERELTVPCALRRAAGSRPDADVHVASPREASAERAATQPRIDFAGLWVYLVAPGNDGSVAPDDGAAAFTGDLEPPAGARTGLGRAACVVQLDRCSTTCAHPEPDHEHRRGGVRVQFLGDSVDVVPNRLRRGFADDAMRAAVGDLPARVVVLSPELKPVSTTASPTPGATSAAFPRSRWECPRGCGPAIACPAAWPPGERPTSWPAAPTGRTGRRTRSPVAFGDPRLRGDAGGRARRHDRRTRRGGAGSRPERRRQEHAPPGRRDRALPDLRRRRGAGVRPGPRARTHPRRIRAARAPHPAVRGPHRPPRTCGSRAR